MTLKHYQRLSAYRADFVGGGVRACLKAVIFQWLATPLYTFRSIVYKTSNRFSEIRPENPK